MDQARAGADTGILGPVGAPTGGWLGRHRYGALATVVLVLTAIQTRNGQWSTDMWEHVAVVRELIAHPFDPAHPQVASDATHPGYSPYTVGLGLIGNGLGVGALGVLSAAALVNVGLLLVALRTFVVEVTGNRRAPFWALVLVLALWGLDPYRYSGFYGLNSIGFVAPYPSTFATAVALGTLVAALRWTRERRPGLLAVVALGTALVALVHPLSAPWLALALAAVAGRVGRDRRALAALGAAGIVAVGLALAWPWYSLLDLVRSSDELDALNRSMYVHVAQRIFPALLGLVVVARRSRVDRLDLLGLFLAGSGGLWLVGALTDNTSFGRSLPFVVLVLHVALADGIGRIEATTSWRSAPGRVRAGAAGLVGLLLLGVVTAGPGLVRMVPEALLPASTRSSEALVRPDERYGFLTDSVGRTEVVTGSRVEDDRVIPALAGRTLALGTPRPFVTDADARRAARRTFLDPATAPARRAEIQERYDLRFVLLHAEDPRDRRLLAALERAGAQVVHDDGDLVLVEL